MCDEGRFGWKYIHDDARLVAPRIGRISPEACASAHSDNGHAGNGHVSVAKVSTAAAETVSATEIANQLPVDLAEIDPWPTALDATRAAISEAMGKDGSKFIAVFSPMMTLEEAYLLAKFLRSGSAKPVAGTRTSARCWRRRSLSQES